MSPAKKFAGCVFAGAAASIPMIAAAQTSPTLMVNDEAPLAVSTFSYAATDSNVSELKVTSDGFLLCANVGPAIPTSSKKLTPSRPRWTLPSVVDVQSMGYSGGMLRVNKPVDTLSVESTLACTVRTSEGTANPNGPYGDVIFQDAFVPTRDRLYAGMVNWRPDVAFNGWSPNGDSVLPGVPTDPCTLDLNVDTPLVSEASVCAAATGVRPATGETWGQRAATMWTVMAGSKFVYLARIDARIGPQSGPPNGNFPQAPTGFSAPTAGSVDIAIRVMSEPPQNLVARDMGPVHYVACASSAWAREHGMPVALPDLPAAEGTGKSKRAAEQAAGIVQRRRVAAEQKIFERVQHRELENFLFDVGECSPSGLRPGLPVELALREQIGKAVDRGLEHALPALGEFAGTVKLGVERGLAFGVGDDQLSLGARRGHPLPAQVLLGAQPRDELVLLLDALADEGDLGRRDAELGDQPAQPGLDRLGRIGRRGGNLEVAQAAVARVIAGSAMKPARLRSCGSASK